MMNRIEQFADNLKSESRLMADRAVAGLRTAGLETAGFISRTKRPVHAVADTTLKLNALSHKSIEKLLKQQVQMIDELIDGSAERLEMAAKAKDVKSLFEKQVSSLPKSRDHAVKNARKTMTLVRDTGDAFGDLFKDVVVDISGAASKKAPARKKTTAKKRTAKKAAAKKTTARKTTAKKRTTRKASTRKTSAKKAAASKPATTSQAA
jgi:phasin family protein